MLQDSCNNTAQQDIGNTDKPRAEWQPGIGRNAVKAGTNVRTVAGNPPRQSDKRYKAVMEQSSRWLAQAPLRIDRHNLYARFFASFTACWVQWHEYREENRRLRMVADKHQITMSILNELHPG